MRIAVLSDPNNFHTQKWAKALQGAGAEVIVMSYDPVPDLDIKAIQLKPPIGNGKGGYTYVDYLRGGKVLRQALEEYQIDVVNPLNITPFGVWAMYAGFHPTVACAFGADVLEYPPRGIPSPLASGRSWDSVTVETNRAKLYAMRLKRKVYQRKVTQAIRFADLVTGDNQYLVDCMNEWFSLAPGKTLAVRWGVEPDLFEAKPEVLAGLRMQLDIPIGQKVVLSPRGAKPIYQADIIIDAFEKMLAQGRPDTSFIMLGAGYALSPEVSNQAENLSKSYRNFRFVPKALPREMVYALWNLVDVFVSAPIYDGYSAALAEGRFVGAIPVVNDIPANREVILHDQNGWICRPFDADQLAHDLGHLLDHLQEYQDRFAPVNRDWVLRHSLIADNARRFLEIVAQRFF